ncbi:MAG: 3-hydroxyacyl-ACP dehydratase FabZ [Acidobacteriota bacterium]
MHLSLPLDQTVIQRILPHRHPFLLVDRITEFEPDTRIVGIKSVSLNDKYLSTEPGQPATLPWPILTEAIAQVGAILILTKPENDGRLIFFMGIDHARYRRPARAGEQVEIVATVRRLRSRMGRLHGIARVNGELCAEGTMAFSLGKRANDAT